MKKTRNSRKLTKWQEATRRKANSLVKALDISGPAVPLQPIAELCHAEIEFRPLLIDGETAEKLGGFKIYCNSDAAKAEEWSAALKNPEDEGRTLPKRERFTIAHELVHTFFYDIDADGSLQDNFKAKNDEQSDQLETLCNEGASHLLLPGQWLEERLNDGEILDPEFLWNLSEEFRVSPETLIYRLKKNRSSHPGRGIFVIRQSEDEPYISGFVMDRVAKGLFPGIENGSSIMNLRIDAPRIKAFGGPDSRTTCSIDARPSPQRCELRQHTCGPSLSLLTVEVIW